MVESSWEELPCFCEIYCRNEGTASMEYYVAKVRLQKYMTIRELSEKSGVAKSHIQKIESGEAAPSLEVMCRLAEALECDLSELYKYK